MKVNLNNERSNVNKKNNSRNNVNKRNNIGKTNNKRNNNKFIFMLGSLLVILLIMLSTTNFLDNNFDLNTEKNKSIINRTKALENNSISNNEYLILVNKKNSIAENYEPDDLVVPNIKLYTTSEMTQNVRQAVATALENMFNDAKKDGIELVGISAYRSYEYQVEVYNNKVNADGKAEANKLVAVPGTSEHQTGLSIDILSSEYTTLDEGFEDTKAFKWISENMSKYGFILRYPKGKEDITGYDYEPWHIRYVGVEPATEIMDKGITLEEYLSK